jgi:hypothetical protein
MKYKKYICRAHEDDSLLYRDVRPKSLSIRDGASRPLPANGWANVFPGTTRIGAYCYVTVLVIMVHSKPKSQYDWRSVNQSVSLGVQPPSEAHDQIFITVWQLRSCFCAALSLMRGRACLLYMLLALASSLFLGSECLGTRDLILLSQIWDFPFCRLLLLAGWPMVHCFTVESW